MATARILTDGSTQILVIPKEFHFDCTEVEVTKTGTEIKLAPKTAGTVHNDPETKTDPKIAAFFKKIDELGGFTDDVLENIIEARKNEIPTKREEI